MGTIDSILFLIILCCYCFKNTGGNPIDTSVLNCDVGSNKELGPVDEGYNGAVEEFTGVLAEYNVQLVGYLFPSHIQFLELMFFPENSTATVYSKSPLDADVLIESQGELYYSLRCSNSVENTRVLMLNDKNDNTPIFDAPAYNSTVSERLAVNSAVIQVRATDADVSPAYNRITYSIMPPVPSEFEMTFDGTIVLKKSLNYNVATGYSFMAKARDDGDRSATVPVTITVEDFDNMNPYFNQSLYNAVIRELEVGVFLSIQPEAIEARDGDTGINQLIIYSISAVSPSDYTSSFNIDAVSGIITVVNSLDREEVAMVTVNIKAAQSDDSLKTAQAVVSVTVEDVNDNAPEFDQSGYSVTILENTPEGSFVLTVRVTDRDEGGFNGTLRIIPDSAPFSISPYGPVLVKNSTALDREETPRFSLQVVAVDSPTNGLSATAQLNITVLDVNDNNPQFLPLPDPVLIPEGNYSAQNPRDVCRISTTDLDQGDNGKVTLSLSNPSALFQFREDGTLLAVGPLDREAKDAYELEIIASDHGTPQRMNVTHITVTITDVNDNDPEFSQTTYSRDILVKDAKEGDLVLTLSATDRDAGNNSRITYSFPAGSPLLKLNSETGEITVTSDLLEITKDTTLKLTALAQDHGEPQRTSTATVLVYLFRPGVDFESSVYNFIVAENEPKGTRVGVVKALTGNSSVQVTYTLRSYRHVFSVDKQGVVRTLHPLDKEKQERYTIAVEAKDSRTPPNTVVTMVSVQVEDVNEAPEFTSSSYSAKIFSIIPYKYPIVQVEATDKDAGQTWQLVYSLAEGSPLFDVEPSSGLVYVVSVEGQSGEKSLKVKATDPQGLSATADVKVTIQESKTNGAVVISLNRPFSMVDENVRDMERSLGLALNWTVTVISIVSANSAVGGVRYSRDNVKTYVTFIATGSDGTIVPAKDVVRKLESERETVTAELTKVFGEGVEYAVETEPGAPDHFQYTVTIVMSVLLLLVILLIARSDSMKKLINFRKNRQTDHQMSNINATSKCYDETTSPTQNTVDSSLQANVQKSAI
ncbi:cadherin EGF LAG seven-pass G-type receptor 2-like [Anguilla anguilla]|uniref:cadherin EGF LAG seven-pass G-type receptor 2-like n=1 Tax=Anguilla anguilla TaxID=7936 RepID=UPI0015AC14EF|nr:cadherin EGF LAG seven-pass G-type receptor 2-like [Anguilla anguilla]